MPQTNITKQNSKTGLTLTNHLSASSKKHANEHDVSNDPFEDPRD
jgi:hypothetical protein